MHQEGEERIRQSSGERAGEDKPTERNRFRHEQAFLNTDNFHYGFLTFSLSGV